MMKTFTVSTAEEVLNITADEGGHWDDLQPGTNKVVATVNTDTEPVNFVSSTDWMAAQVRNSLFGEYAGCPSCLHRTDEDRPRRAQLHVDIGPQTQPG